METLKKAFVVIFPLACTFLSMILLVFVIALIAEGPTFLRVIMLPAAIYLFIGSSFSMEVLRYQSDKDLESVKFVLIIVAISVFAFPYFMRAMTKN